MFDPQAALGVHVWLEEGKYYLHAPEFDEMAEAGEVHEHGEVLVRRLNGVGFLKFGAFRPVNAEAVRGRPGGVTVFPGTGVLYMPTRTLLAYLDYTPDRPPAMNVAVGPIVAALPPVERWADVAAHRESDVDVALDLVMVAVRSEDWRRLHFVYEIIERRFGQPSKVAKERRCSSAEEIIRFSDTANNRQVLGIKARHGHMKNKPPANPMTFQEARALVHGLLLAWVRYLAEPARDRRAALTP